MSTYELTMAKPGSESDFVQRKALRSETEIQSAYSSPDVAASYIDCRFVAPLMALMHRRQVAAVNGLLARQRPEQTLEIAPGPGRITRHVAEIGRLTCLEFNAAMIDQARPACRPSIQWIQGNAFELPFEESFDCVYSFRFVRHFQDQDRSRLYAQIARVLRPGGQLLLDAVNERVSLPRRRAQPQDYPVYDKLYRSVDELHRELAPHGLVLESAQPVLRWFSVQSRVQTLIGPRSDWLCRRIIAGLEAIPSTAPLEWIVQCRRA